MCHATQIRTDPSDYRRHFDATVDRDAFVALYQRRLRDPALRIPKAVDDSFRRIGGPQDPIVQLIDAYTAARTQDLEQALFAERNHLVGSRRRTVGDSVTDGPGSRQRIASLRIRKLLISLGDTKRSITKAQDARVTRDEIAPVAVWRDDRAVMVPMRYQPYPNADPVAYRHRTCLKEVFGITHGLILADAFFDKAAIVRSEDADGDDEIPPQQVELRCAPLSAEPMLLACVWWHALTRDALPVFTILMDLPPPEVSRAGLNRCVIPIAPQYVKRWLCPNGDVKQAESILDARLRPFFESEKLAA